MATATGSRTFRALASVVNDPFYRGSVLLLINTAVLAGFGFAFWALAAHSYSAAAVGAFSGVTSGVSLLTSVASLGWPNTITRSLASAPNGRELLAVSVGTITIVGGSLSLIVLLGLGDFLPASLHLRQHGSTASLVVVLVIFTAVSGLIDAGLIATRSSLVVLTKNLLASIIKVVALFLLAGLGSAGLLLAYGSGMFVSTGISAVALARRVRGGRPGRQSLSLLRENLSRTAGSYLATVMGILPSTVVPIEVLVIRGPVDTARFSAAFLIASFLTVIPSTVAGVLFAEASRAGVTLGKQLRKSLRGVYGLLLPALLVMLAAAPLVLHLFGSAYAAAATGSLRVLSFSALLSGGAYLVDSALIARDRMTAYIATNGLNAALVLGCVGLLLPRGLTAGTVGWAVAQGASLVIALVVLATGSTGKHRVPGDALAAGQLAANPEPEIHELLSAWPTMPTALIAEGIGPDQPAQALLDRVIEVRSAYLRPGPHLSRSRFVPGWMAQCGLWFPPVAIPAGDGQVLTARQLPVLTMITGYSRWLSALLIPSQDTPDIFAAWWELLAGLGAVPQLMTWDEDAPVGQRRSQHSEPTPECRRFCRVLGTRVEFGPAADPHTRELIERAQAYLEASFLPGRVFASPADFNAQLSEWLVAANTRHRPAPNRAPGELIGEDLRGMLPLPHVPPPAGWRMPVLVSQEPFVQFGGNRYAVHPAVTGRKVEVTVSLDTVEVLDRGRVIAEHARGWGRGQTIGDPWHGAPADQAPPPRARKP